MTATSYRVIFGGELVEDQQPAEVKRRLAALFKVDETVIQRRFFTQTPVVVKKEVPHAAALKYQQILQKAGIICHIESLPQIHKKLHSSRPTPQLSSQKPPPSPGQSRDNPSSLPGTTRFKPIQRNKKELISCPKCGFEQEPAETCIRCGIIIEKYCEREHPLSRSSSVAPNKALLQQSDVVDKSFEKLRIVALVFLILIGFAGAFHWWNSRPVNTDVEIVVGTLPEQLNIANPTPFSYKGYTITPLAEFSLAARVLSRKDYSSGRESELSPVDLALGWGPMSDSQVIRNIRVSQSNRWYHWNVNQFPIPRRDIETHSANMHILPANSAVREELDNVRTGNFIALQGYLVRVDGSGGWFWKSSLTREDTGNGACEVIWVEAFQITH